MSIVNRVSRKKSRSGLGLLNKLINTLPVELHIPTYRFCGPGTNIEKRLYQKGINPLDQACKEHDLAYLSKDLKSRHKADKILEQKAIERITKGSIGEKIAAVGVAGTMKMKRKLGMGMRQWKKKKIKGMKKRRGKGITFNRAVNTAKNAIIGSKHRNIKNVAKAAVNALRKYKIRGPKSRIIQIPKAGGFLPLIPLFAGLSALGALSGGAAGIAKAVNDAKAARERLEEQKRHNKFIEQVKVGDGLYLKPYKKGCGLYLKPYSKNC